MNSTNVPSNSKQKNQNGKSELTMMAIGIDKDQLRNYEVKTGENNRAGIFDYIQQQLGPGIPTGNATLGRDGKLRTGNNISSMKNPNAYSNIKKNEEKRRKLKGLETQAINKTSTATRKVANADISRE